MRKSLVTLYIVFVAVSTVFFLGCWIGKIAWLCSMFGPLVILAIGYLILRARHRDIAFSPHCKSCNSSRFMIYRTDAGMKEVSAFRSSHICDECAQQFE